MGPQTHRRISSKNFSIGTPKRVLNKTVRELADPKDKSQAKAHKQKSLKSTKGGAGDNRAPHYLAKTDN